MVHFPNIEEANDTCLILKKKSATHIIGRNVCKLACEFHLRQASGGFKQNIKGAESNMSFTQDCAAFRQKPAIKASPPKETPSDWVYHGHNSSLYRIRGLKLVQRLAKMTC